MKRKLSILLILLLAIRGVITAERQMVSVWYGKMTSDMPERDVILSFRDSQGYMWYGTRSALYRDDGYRTVLFEPEKGNISVLAIAESKDNKLWIGSDDGAFIFDKTNGRFTELDPGRIGGKLVEQVFRSDDGMMWLAQQGVLRRYDSNGTWMADYTTLDRRGNPTRMSGFCQTRKGDIWISTYSRGLYKYDRQNDRFEMAAPVNLDVSFGKVIQDHGQEYMWVMDHDGHIYRFDSSKAGQSDAYVSSVATSTSGNTGKNRIINFIQDDTCGYLWVQLRNSLYAFAPQPDGHLAAVEINGKNGFEGSMINSINEIKGGVWVTCYDAPDYIIELGEQTLRKLEVKGTRERYGNVPVLKAVCQDNDSGLLWLLQSRTGLLLYDPETGRITDHDTDANLLQLRMYRATQIAQSPKYGGVWVSRERESMIYAMSNDGMLMKAVDSIAVPDVAGSKANITSLLEDPHGILWVGAASGLYALDISRRTVTGRYPEIGEVVAISNGPDGDVWAATYGNSLYRIRRSSIKRPERMGEARQYSALAVTKDNVVWLTTGLGDVLEYNPKEDKWTDHTGILELRGIPLLQVHVDPLGHIWIVSNQKVVEYNPVNHAYKIYPAATGSVERGSFLSRTPSVDTVGNLTVGGLGGLYRFKPGSSLDKKKSDVKVHITNVKVNGMSLLFEDSIRYDPSKQAVVLRPEDRNLEIEFSELNPRFAGDVRFAYRLKGFESEWHYTSVGKNTATYTDLPRGNYVLQVKGCDENNLWSDNITELHIRQKPYFYNSWWAWLIYVAILAAGISLLVYYFVERARKKNEAIWSDSQEMLKMRTYLSSPVSLPEEEFRELDKVLLEKATKVVENHLSDPEFDVNVLASEVNMSRSTLARKLKAITDRTPLDFIRQIKMQHARRLLESQNHTVAEVAERVGFEDRRYFTASFKKETGVTPSAYLRGERAQAVSNGQDSEGAENKQPKG